MQQLHLPDNIKVHFAGMECKSRITAIQELGVSYGLFSAFPFVYKKLFGKKVFSPSDFETIKAMRGFRHVIQDSGLFSLLYGAKAHLAKKDTVFKWYDALVEWTLAHGEHDITVVEIDCQDILGTEIAWDLRERLRRDLPDNRIINVFHLCDGIKGLDRLIEFSDYIGVGSGSPKNSSYTMYEASVYIKSKNPLCDIHLLGCTAFNTIKRCNFCTSCDSITYTRAVRFGEIGPYHINDLDTDKIKRMFGSDTYKTIQQNSKETPTNGLCAAVELNKRLYEKYAGNQDFTRYFQ